MTNKMRLAIHSLYVFLIAFLSSTSIRAEVPHNPRSFTTIEELTIEGKSISLKPGKYAKIIADDSRIAILFDREKLKLLEAESKEELMSQLLAIDIGQKLKLALAEPKVNKDSVVAVYLKMVNTLTDVIGGPQIKIEASVVPEKGTPYTIPVANYSVFVADTSRENTDIQSIPLVRKIQWKADSLSLTVGNINIVENNEIADAIILLQSPTYRVYRGDRITLMVTNTQRNVPHAWTWEFEVKQTGFYVKESSSILLIKRDVNPTEDNKNVFKPTAATGLIFKLPKRDYAWNFVDMGIGFQAAFLDFKEELEIEVGFGMIVTFFRDVLQIGVGRNLSISGHTTYYSLGIGFMSFSVDKPTN